MAWEKGVAAQTKTAHSSLTPAGGRMGHKNCIIVERRRNRLLFLVPRNVLPPSGSDADSSSVVTGSRRRSGGGGGGGGGTAQRSRSIIVFPHVALLLRAYWVSCPREEKIYGLPLSHILFFSPSVVASRRHFPNCHISPRVQSCI